MTERLMGVETEYAFVAFQQDGKCADARQVMSQIERLAEKHIPHLPGRGQRGIFLQNGSRFYRDFSNGDAHQELTTPECPNPWDVVRYIVANEQILLGLTGRLLAANGHLREALYFRHNVDYSGSGTSWGTHESYLTRSSIGSLAEQLIPHLVSRIIFTGAGGFHPFQAKLEFTLSPRAAHVSEEISHDTERNRPLFNLRDEALCGGGYHRLHVVCGESLCSHTATWLRAGTTALVVALADGGVKPGKEVGLYFPVRALHDFARDPTCRTEAMITGGRMRTALEIQRHYLALAEAHMTAEFMPPWAPQVCRHWRAILDRLEHGAPDSVATVLDWAIKYALFTDRLAQRGFAWDHQPNGAASAQLARLRQELFEMYARFGQLGDRGIFNNLDRTGVLQHEFPGVDNFPHAMVNPPNLGRARLRGTVIQRLSGRSPPAACDWAGVWNIAEQSFLDLAQPFEETEVWKPMPIMEVPVYDPRRRVPELAMIEQHYLAGQFEQAGREIELIEAARTFIPFSERLRLLRLKACLQARRGRLDGIEILDGAGGPRPPGVISRTDYLLVLRHSGLAPRAEMQAHIRAMLDQFNGQPPAALPVDFREHWGAYLLWTGQLVEAQNVLTSAAQPGAQAGAASQRCRALWAEVLRRLGRGDEARSVLEAVRQEQIAADARSDLACFTLPILAKLAGGNQPAVARAVLAEARFQLTRVRDRLGLIRNLILDARFAIRAGDVPPGNEVIVAMARETPALAACELYRLIIRRWEDWSRDFTTVENQDVFWGL